MRNLNDSIELRITGNDPGLFPDADKQAEEVGKMDMDHKLRIGILTIHAAINYGSMLQAYALQAQLEAEAGENTVELIDYLPPYIMNGYSLNPSKHLCDSKDFFKYLLNLGRRTKWNRAFQNFARDYFRLSPRAYTDATQLEADSANWDVCVLGSDQVWNPEIVADDRAFWLEFAKHHYKASFSSSFGTTAIPEPYKDGLIRELKTFDKISVREPSAAGMLQAVGKPIAVTCDPVFLLSADQWADLERKPAQVPEHYIVMYTVERNEKLEALTKQISAHYGIPVVDLGIRSDPRGYFGVHSPKYGPREFLYLIHHADYMLTNSFHGTAFGTIFGKKCVSILHRSRGTRIRELLDLADRSRYILPENASAEQLIDCFNRERTEDASRLLDTIAASKTYLKDMLREAYSAKVGDNEPNAKKKQ